MKIRSLDEVLKNEPDFKPGWESRPDGGFENSRLKARVRRVAVCDDEGKPKWDQPQIEEIGGAIIVPYYVLNYENQKKKSKFQPVYKMPFIGLISQVRPVVRDEDGEQGKVVNVEVPRGFGIKGETSKETAIRELGEETGKVVTDLEYIGRINANTTYFVTYGEPIYSAEVDSAKVSSFKPDAKEKILKCEFHEFSEVLKMMREDKIFDGFTEAALMCFTAHYFSYLFKFH